MKNYFLSMLVIATTLFTTSCSKDDSFGAYGDTSVTFKVSTEELATRAYGDGTKALHLMYAVYDETSLVNGKAPVVEGVSKLAPGTNAEFSGLSATVKLALLSGNEYSILFWATSANYEDAYTINWADKTVTMKNEIPGNVEAYDSFFFHENKFRVENTINKPITLVRPFAQLNIGTDDIEKAEAAGLDIAETKVTVQKAPKTLDVTDGSVSGEQNITYRLGDIPTESGDDIFPISGYNYLAMNYVLASADQHLYDVALSYMKDASNEFSHTYISVPVRRNYRTNIYGSILTNPADYFVNIEDELAGQYDIKEVATADDLNTILQTCTDSYIYIKLKSDVSADVSEGSIKWGGADTKMITIDGCGHKLTLKKKNNDWNKVFMNSVAGKLVLNDLTLDTNKKGNDAWNNYTIGFDCVVEMNNVTTSKGMICLRNDAVLNNVDINEDGDYYGLYITAAAHDGVRASTARGHNITINNLTITAPNGRGIKIIDEYIDEENQGVVTLDITNATFVTDKKAAILVTSKAGANISLKGDIDISQTGDRNFAVWVDEDRAEYANNVSVEGGNIKIEGEIIETIASIDELGTVLKAAGEAGAGNTTIILSSDIDMTGQPWTPIPVDGYNGADIVTLNGNGKTITGLTGALFAGGFAGGSGIVIKDLTIEDATIVADNTQGYGAFVNCADSMDEITLINCHLRNSTIITPNDGEDESRIGGLIGWTAGYGNQNDGPVDSYITVENCSVIGCTLKGFGSIGGICGHAGTNAATFTTIENCTIENNNLISTDDDSWRVGVVVGTANIGECEISGITESGNTLTQEKASDIKNPTGDKRNYYGRFVPAGTGSLTIDGVAISAE